MMSRYEFSFRVLFQKEIKPIDSTIQSWEAPNTPYIDFLTLNKQYSDIDFEFKKLEMVFNKMHPVEVITDSLIIVKSEVISNVVNVNYINFLRNVISQIYNVRFDEQHKQEILIKNFNKNFFENKIKLLDDVKNHFIWTTYSINVYGRQYIPNKHWEAFPKFKFLKAIILNKEVRKIDLERHLSKNNLDIKKTSYGNLFD